MCRTANNPETRQQEIVSDCGSCGCGTSARAGRHTGPNASGNCGSCGIKLVTPGG